MQTPTMCLWCRHPLAVGLDRESPKCALWDTLSCYLVEPAKQPRELTIQSYARARPLTVFCVFVSSVQCLRGGQYLADITESSVGHGDMYFLGSGTAVSVCLV